MNTESIALYIHIPFCQRKCRYCSFYSVPLGDHNIGELIEALIAELNTYDITQKVTSAYIGGGSPTCIGAQNILRLVEEIQNRCSPEEFTIEANPAQADKAILQNLKSAGINRLSIGAQSLNQKDLDFLGRTHTVKDIENTIDQATATGFDNISIDLIFAIPHSTIQSWNSTLEKATQLNVHHISAYALTYENQTPLHAARQSHEFTPIDEETDRIMYDLAIDKLNTAGFCQYEISNFARQGFQCAHNLQYWANNQYIGIGPAAASYYKNNRSTNIANIVQYINKVKSGQPTSTQSETPSPTEIACQTAVLNLRRINGINIDQYKTKTGYDLMELFKQEIENNIKLELIELTDGSLRLTRKALPIADSVLCDFAAI